MRDLARSGWTEHHNGRTDPRSAPAELSEVAITIYRHAVTHGYIDPRTIATELGVAQTAATQATDDLRRLKLLNDKDPGILVPVQPDLARELANEPLVDEIEARERLIESNNRQLQRVSEVLTRTTTPAPDTSGVRVVTDPAVVRREIDAARLSCHQELVTTQPGGPRSQGDIAESFQADVSMLKRGVARRMLYQHTARANLGMRSYVGQLAEHGGIVRTTAEALERMLIFDQGTAVVPIEPPGPEPAGSVIITTQPVVQLLRRSFERLWSSATPFEDTDPPYDEVFEDIKMSLLPLMASGLKDDAIAHRLGMATRTCRRHISALMEQLQATSRFQAGVRASQRGMLPIHDADVVRNDDLGDSYPWW